MELLLFNTQSGKKEIFKPLEEGKVSIYVCGMTVYDYAHLGHARAYVSFDIVNRVFKALGYKVKYIRNITDIDDKIIQRAQEKADYSDHPLDSCLSLAEKFTEAFHEDMSSLNLLKPTIEPKATTHIQEMVHIIEGLIEKGHAYEVEGNVYFHVQSFDQYGALSGRNPEEMETVSRLEKDTHKKSPMDFALWKKSLPNEPSFDSPFGPGRPGWHIECSAMSMKYLGNHFDIHGGGRDLVFPHHENEMCQSKAFSGEAFTNYWLHNGFVTINREKMSKSLKNFKTLRDLFQKYSAMDLKFYLLSTHYRSPLEFSDQLILNAQEGFRRIENALQRFDLLKEKLKLSLPVKNKLPTSFLEAMVDDFNTPKALAVVFEKVSSLNLLLEEEKLDEETLKVVGEIFGMLDVLGLTTQKCSWNFVPKSSWDKDLDISDIPKDKIETPLSSEEIEELIQKRGKAKEGKKFDLADAIRDFLQSHKVLLRDKKDGVEWLLS